jgi:riboflavin kinase/FMN adenylyltransferase
VTTVVVGRDQLVPPPEGSAITIGTFDGVHLGHRALIARTVERAGELGAASVVLTWDRHPAATLRPDRAPRLLTSPERKIELLSATGVDTIVVIPFDEDLASLPPEGFVREVLVSGLGARAVTVGEGWRFGHKAAGDVELLRSLGSELGFEAEGMALQEVAGGPASSSRIRRAVAEADLELARTLLGRPHDISGRVVRGAGRGRGLGFPTANLAVAADQALPPIGVYAGQAEVIGLTKPAAVNIGVNPTFGGKEGSDLSIEAYLLDLDADIYGQKLRLELWQRLREEVHFGSVGELVAQIDSDVTATRELVTGAGEGPR